MADRDRNLRDLLAYYGGIGEFGESGATADDYNGTDRVLIELSRITDEIYVTFHIDAEDAIIYHDNQECPGDWLLMAVWDLDSREDLSDRHSLWPAPDPPTLPEAVEQCDSVMMIEDRAPCERRLIEFAIDIQRWHTRMGLGDETTIGDHSGADQLQELYEVLGQYGLEVA